MITFAEAHEHLRYEPDTGKLWWRARASGRRMNKPAGAKTNGYISVYVLGKMHRASRLIWFMQTGAWPKEEIDHKNRKRSDDRWSNLREATRSQNQHNTRRYSNNKSGITGVTWHGQHKKWYVTIQKDNRPKFIGLFTSKKRARAAYLAAAKENFKEFACAA